MSAGQICLILGGARSGKSRYAEALAQRLAGAGPVIYLATATAGDEEMRARIAAHQAQRPAAWHTVEAPLDPGHDLRLHPAWPTARVIVVDCISILVSNVMLVGMSGDFDEASFDAAAAEARVIAAIDALMGTLQAGPATALLVSNEVGLGIVPMTLSGRAYRDILGRVNARLAAVAHAAAFMVAGQPLDLRGLAAAWEARLAALFGPSPSA